MPLNDDAPMFFASSLGGLTPDGPNVVLTFVAPIPSADFTKATHQPNVRIVMSSSAVENMMAFLNDVKARADKARESHPMPETPQ